MVFVYLTALRVLVNGKKGEYKAWGVDGVVTPSYAPMFSKVEHYPLGSAGKAKLRIHYLILCCGIDFHALCAAYKVYKRAKT